MVVTEISPGRWGILELRGFVRIVTNGDQGPEPLSLVQAAIRSASWEGALPWEGSFLQPRAVYSETQKQVFPAAGKWAHPF